jgi:hypothetical protein
MLTSLSAYDLEELSLRELQETLELDWRTYAELEDINASYLCQIIRYTTHPPHHHSLSNFIKSQEKIDLLRMLGAEVHPVPAVAYENPKNYNHQARDYAQGVPNSIWTDQFDNTANARAHYISTGPEIWEQTQGDLDGFVCATGTGGTLAGAGKYLQEKSAGKIQVWLADPPGSVLDSYINSGGKLIERAGTSITEGLYYFGIRLCG